MTEYDLFLDESGEFYDDKRDSQKSPSLVGGLLVKKSEFDESFLRRVSYAHAAEGYDKSMLKLLSDLKSAKHRFVIFENRERIKVVNVDITYLNVICEGLVKLMADLAADSSGEQIRLNVLIANRNRMAQKTESPGSQTIEIIPDSDYKARLEERLILALGRSGGSKVQYDLSLSSARRNKRLMIADYICNTYFTRKAKSKFSQEEQQLIEELYADALILPVFDNATSGYVKRLLAEGRYGETIAQLCALAKLSGVTESRNKLLERMANLPQRERGIIFSQASLQIGRYNYERRFDNGIAFAENYKNYILQPLRDRFCGDPKETGGSRGLSADIAYWTFDTDFYLLTMHDHLGNTLKCAEYLEKCRGNINAINRSWEHLGYYLKFRIRELNCRIGQFDFEKAVEGADHLIRILKDTKELFAVIGAYDGTESSSTSELLGKAYGVKLEAYLNILHQHPELADEAKKISDDAIAEFSDAAGQQRQWLYRCQLMCELGEAEEAVECLLKSLGIAPESRDFVGFINKAISGNTVDSFAIMHYTNVLRALILAKSDIVKDMADALLSSSGFETIIRQNQSIVHPWQMILWNISIYYRATGRKEKYVEFYEKAISIAAADPGKATMYSFAVSMSAENLLYLREHTPKATSSAEVRFRKYMGAYHKNSLPESMKNRFPQAETAIDNKRLSSIAINYLR